jgi:transcriptional regulator with XRE-family HTH domain
MQEQTAAVDEALAEEDVGEAASMMPPPSAVDGHQVTPLLQAKLVDALHELQKVHPSQLKNHDRAVRALQESLTIIGDSDDSEMLGPIDWPKFGSRLRVRRIAAGLTQDSLAELVGVTGTTIRCLELHKRQARRGLMLKLLAVPALNLRVSDIELSADQNVGTRWTPSSWLGPTYDPVGMITQLAETLSGPSGQLEQTYAYIESQSAKDWMTTSSSPEYEVDYRACMPVEPMARRIAEAIGDQALSVSALGCGDGKTESVLLHSLQRHLKMPSKTELFLLDISHSLLNAAYRHLAETLPNLKTYTIHGNFLDLPRLPMVVSSHRGRRRLFTMLGLTLINLNDELRFFRDTLSCCASGDLFLCDVLIVRAPAGERERILRLDPIGSGKMRATHASWLEGIIRRNCHGADEVKFRWELTTHGGVPGSYGFDAIATVKMRNTQPDRRFLMTRVRRYDTKLLSASLTEMGWNTIERIDYGTDGKKTMSLLLLQKQ